MRDALVNSDVLTVVKHGPVDTRGQIWDKSASNVSLMCTLTSRDHYERGLVVMIVQVPIAPISVRSAKQLVMTALI